MFDQSLTDSGSLILSFLIGLPLWGALALFLVSEGEHAAARLVALFFSGLTFAVSLVVLWVFNLHAPGFQLAELRPWLTSFGVNYAVGVDGLSLWLVLLTTLLTLLVVIASNSIRQRVRAYLGFLLLLETGMLGTLLALDGVTFYVFWELMLIPMYFLIGVWGGSRRIYAAIKFVLYTAAGSLLMLVAIIYLGFLHQEQFGYFSFYFGDWAKLAFGPREELLLFAVFALAFAIKVPIFPLHTWLPDAHVEAPTGGSVILAGVLLKMGLYGLMRICVPLFPHAALSAAPLFAVLGVVGIIYGSLVAWVQTDMKKLVAYSSVSHLGFCVLGFAAIDFQGMQGAILQMLNHGVSTAALFFSRGSALRPQAYALDCRLWRCCTKAAYLRFCLSRFHTQLDRPAAYERFCRRVLNPARQLFFEQGAWGARCDRSDTRRSLYAFVVPPADVRRIRRG